MHADTSPGQLKFGKYILAFIFQWITLQTVIAREVPHGVSQRVFDVLIQASDYMDRSNYDSAQFVISKTFAQTEIPIGEVDLYYLHCYEAEIMYYNALFEQGLNSSLRGIEIAKAQKNDTLIGNSENLIGLFMMNLGRNSESLEHLKRAMKLIPQGHSNDFVAYNYHVLSNIGECFLKLNQPDSAILYSERSTFEAHERGRSRGVALAHWNISEAWLFKKDPEKAALHCMLGYDLVKESVQRDVVQLLCSSFMRIYELKANPDSIHYWLRKGLDENLNPLSTDLSRILFLELATDLCVRIRDIETGAQLLKDLNKLQRMVSNKQQNQRMAILKDYYEKNQKLVVAGERDLAQQKALGLRKTISLVLGIAALLLITLIFILVKIYRQRQRIAQLQYNEQLQSTSRSMELQALENRMEAVFTERNRIASDLHDDIGAALSSIRIYSGAAEKQFNHDPKESLKLIERINESSSGMMERMSDIVWSINPKNDNVQSLVFRMKTYATETLGPLDIIVRYDVDEQVNKIHPTILSRRNIYLMFKEALNNVAKYGGATEVKVKLVILEDIFHVHIDDNGKGFHVNQAQKGNGLINMSNRAKAIGGNFHIASHIGRGTQLHFYVEITKISDSNYK